MFKEVPVLKFIALTRIVRLLWSSYDIQNLVSECFLEGYQTQGKWNRIEESLKLKICNCLIVPHELQMVMSSLVKPIGGCIKNFIDDIYSKYYLPSNFMGIFSWTFLGIIDAKKTAKAVIKDVNLLITERYEIACTYCLQDEIPILWSKLPETSKYDYLHDIRYIPTLPYFPVYWAYYMTAQLYVLDEKVREEHSVPITCHYFGVLQARKIVNQVAVEYFIQKLSIQEKEEYLRVFFSSLEFPLVMENYSPSNSYVCDVIYSLLKQMTENKRMSIFEENAYHILKNFLEFPYGGMFLEIESVVQKFLTHDQRKALYRRYKETIRYFVFRTVGSNSRKRKLT
ncbi:ANK_REP_REGION domain-containing protein [Trichonephila clavata]|uniref:ANK_REP_REGION domain-containing protein n=1 Tax=Trichonephila clavata TaxID=2740835 RepID=A0A8X6L3I2_TRICU|nr:ANK_REP_REGION domain-containing protein [Trichonephila clavata]